MIKPDVILWDWDNTLIDSRSVAARALIQLGTETNVPVTDADVSEVVGGHLVDFWYRNYGDNPLPIVEKFLAYYRLYSSDVQLFPETSDVLKWVHQLGIPQIIVTNKDQDIVDSEVDRFGIRFYFKKIVGTLNHAEAKPEKAFADRALGQEWPKHILMIGDGQSDMAFAKTLNAFGLFIHDGDDMPFPCDKKVRSLAEVWTFLKEENKSWGN
jgi:HAD superfamily hydrolase (TIGR01549 family)